MSDVRLMAKPVFQAPGRSVAPLWIGGVAAIVILLGGGVLREAVSAWKTDPLVSLVALAGHSAAAFLIVQAIADLITYCRRDSRMDDDWVEGTIEQSRLFANPPYLLAFFRDLVDATLLHLQQRWMSLYLLALLIAPVGFYLFVNHVRFDHPFPIGTARFSLLMVPLVECLAAAGVIVAGGVLARRIASSRLAGIDRKVDEIFRTGALQKMMTRRGVPAEKIIEDFQPEDDGGFGQFNGGGGGGPSPFDLGSSAARPREGGGGASPFDVGRGGARPREGGGGANPFDVGSGGVRPRERDGGANPFGGGEPYP